MTTMTTTPECDFEALASDQEAAKVDPAAALLQDAYWHRAYWHERYFSPGLDYEDYAPAYCVGYIGFVQYGGEFADAERSLWANWERIKGDSRLPSDDAQLAMRAAWDRMASQSRRHAVQRASGVGLFRQRMRTPSFKLSAAAVR